MGTLVEYVDVACRKRPAVLMGVLNVTPDSFFAPSRIDSPDQARRAIDRMIAEGADIIDIGAESTRPGAEPVPPDVQIERALPAIEYAVQKGALVSIDTASPRVARRALALGARIVNDVSCLTDPELARVTEEHDADLVLMHSRGSMTDMPGFGSYPADAYDDVVADVAREWAARRDRAVDEGLAAERIWFDPGLGFHKSAEQSTELLRRLQEFSSMTSHIVLGPSRKSFIGALDDSGPGERLGGTIAASIRAVLAGARILRVHDVQAVGQALVGFFAFSPLPSPRLADAAPAERAKGAHHDA